MTHIPLRTKFAFTGQLQLTEEQRQDLRGQSLVVNLVDAQGERRRVSAQDVQFDVNTGVATVSLQSSVFSAERALTAAERLSAMGQFEERRTQAERGFRQNALGYSRLEIHPEKPSPSGVFSFYTQQWLSLPAMARLSDQRVQSLSSEVITGLRVGRVQAIVFDEAGAPIRSALLTVVPLLAKGNRQTDLQPWNFVDEARLSPIGSLTAEDGTALIWPVPAQIDPRTGGEPKFQVLATANGFCPAVTPVLGQSDLATPVKVILRTCSKGEVQIDSPAWTVAFAPNVKTSSAATESLPAGSALTNQETLQLVFSNRSPVVRGIKVSLLDGVSEQSAVLSEQRFEVFQPQVTIDLPEFFKSGTSSSGPFSIVVESLLSARDTAAGVKPARALLYGEKLVRRLAPVSATRFIVRGAMGVDNIISGQSGSNFELIYRDCVAGTLLSLVFSDVPVSNPNLRWFACDPAGNVLKVDDYATSLSAIGGFKSVQFFIMDTYGNVSRDDTRNRINQRENVWVDFGSPQANQLVFGENIDVVPVATSLPVNEDLPSVQVLRPTNVTQFQVALRSGRCTEISGVDPIKDGVDSTEFRGQKIAKLYAGPQKNFDDMLSAAADCQGGGVTLGAATVVFPAGNIQSPAKIFVTLFDMSGNLGSVELSVPRCNADPPSTVPSENVCWNP